MGTVPPDVESSQKAFTKEQKRLGCSPLTTILQWEEEQAQRVISADDHTVSLAPYASQFPYEVWVVPRRQVHSINDLDDQELRSVATHLKQVTTALGTVDMSYNFFLAEGLAKYKNHFMICLAPRPNIWAGFELNTGVIMHPMPPETATKWYRKTIKDVC